MCASPPLTIGGRKGKRKKRGLANPEEEQQTEFDVGAPEEAQEVATEDSAWTGIVEGFGQQIDRRDSAGGVIIIVFAARGITANSQREEGEDACR